MKLISLPFQDTGVGWYRILQPDKFIKRNGLVTEHLSLPFSGESQGEIIKYSDEFWMNLCKDADIVHSTLLSNTDMLLKLLNLRKHYGFKLIFDIDDNLYAVPEDNPAFNKVQRLKANLQVCMKACDGVTVSVPNLATVYSDLNDNFYVNPNSIDFDLFKPKKNRGKIRIGWRGAFGHKYDLEMIRPVIEAIKKDFDVTFVTLGWNPGWSDEHHEWVDLFSFPEKLASLKLDIALIPLIDSAYNRCKSNLAFLEYSALEVPCIVSPTENQKGLPTLECTSNHDWYDAISKLIENKDSRISLGLEAHDHVKEHYNIKSTSKHLYKWMKELERKKF